MIVIFILLLAATWALGIYEGNSGAAVLLSMYGICALIDKVKERIKRNV